MKNKIKARTDVGGSDRNTPSDRGAQEVTRSGSSTSGRVYSRVQTHFEGESMTQQHFGPIQDVNNIVRRYMATGVDPYESRRQNQRFGYASSETFEDHARRVAEVNSAFEQLPARERLRFDNDPALWLDSLAEIVDSEASQAVSEGVAESTPQKGSKTDPSTVPIEGTE